MRFIVFAFLVLIPAASQGDKKLSSCYKLTSEYIDTFTGKASYPTDYLRFADVKPGIVKFELLQIGSNSHMCALSAFAKRSEDGGLEFKDIPEYALDPTDAAVGLSKSSRGETCTIRFSFSKNWVEIVASDSCNAFCGARGRFGGRLKAANSCDGLSI